MKSVSNAPLAAVIMILFGSCASQLCYAQSAQKISVEQLTDHYADLFGVEINETRRGKVVSPVVHSLPSGHLFTDLVNNGRYFLEYLLRNGAQNATANLSAEESDLKTLQRAYVQNLKRDQRFNQVILPVLVQYLKSRKVEVGVTVDAPREIRLNHAMTVAARFFYPDKILPNGDISAHICTALNGFADFEGDRDLIVEAFAFSAINEELMQPRHGLIQDFQEFLRSAKRLNLSSDQATKLVRLQGIAWAHMTNSDPLRKSLLAGYEKGRSYLPLIVSPG